MPGRAGVDPGHPCLAARASLQDLSAPRIHTYLPHSAGSEYGYPAGLDRAHGWPEGSVVTNAAFVRQVISLAVSGPCAEGWHLWCPGRSGPKGKGSRPCDCDCHGGACPPVGPAGDSPVRAA